MRGPNYPIITIYPEWVQAEEWMGSKNKRWVSLPEDKERWLFKYARVNAGVPTGEHWAEKIAAEVAELLGLRHAEVELATLEGRPGSLSRRFAELSYPGTALVHGNVLLKGHVLGYDLQKKFRQSDHTLGNILRVFDHIIANDEQRMRALDEFMGYLVLDALVLNTDRHHENWALVSHASVFGIADHKLAPTFDHASSLGRELTLVQVREWEPDPVNVLRYAMKARGPIYQLNKDRKGLHPYEVVRMALRVKPGHVIPWLERLRNLDPQELTNVVERVPLSMMDEEYKRFASALLRHMLARLQQLKP